MKTKTKHYKTSPLEIDEFKEIVENFCRKNGLSKYNVSGRNDVLFFSGHKSFLPIIWDFSFEGIFSFHKSYGLISVEFANAFDRVFNFLLGIIWIVFFLIVFLNISLPNYRDMLLLTQAFWLIVIFLEFVSVFFQKKLVNSLCREIPGVTVSLKKKGFSKLLED
ncbi:MAG: hypothetical protein P4L49_16415 [Desulfosporosinus sp.]|nr:hypothetical protein [Desulfosporosinus sp.]